MGIDSFDILLGEDLVRDVVVLLSQYCIFHVLSALVAVGLEIGLVLGLPVEADMVLLLVHG